MSKYQIDPDITKASTLPGSYYKDLEEFQQTKSKIFTRFWQYIADMEVIKSPTMICPKTILPHFLDEPILLTRDVEDRIYCLSNVCTHRANIVAEQPGMQRKLRCRYHGRKFSLNGRFESMPEFDQVKNFPTERDNLTQIQIEDLDSLLIFTSLDPIMDFNSYMKPVMNRISFLPLSEFQFDPSRSRDYLVNAHWALYVDNYLEGFHIPYVHDSLNQVLDYGSYRTELFDYGTLQLGIAEGSESTFNLPDDHPDHGTVVAAYYFWLFPNIMLNFYPWGLSLNLIQPLAIDRTKISFRTYIWKPELLEQGAGAGLDRVEREDEIVVENVSRGLKSRLYSSGRFSPSREQGVHHFHRLLTKNWD